MPEINDQQPEEPGTAEVQDAASTRTIFGIKISFAGKGERMEMKDENGQKVLQVNPKRFPNEKEALRKAVIEAAYIDSLKATFATNEQGVIALLKEKKLSAKTALHLRGIKALKLWEEHTAQEIAGIIPAHLTARAQFDFACEQYLLTGKIPDGLSEKVREALSKLPERDSQNVLDVIAQERRILRSAVKHFEKYVAPLREEAAKIDRELKKTEREDYVPPQFRGEMVPLDPESVRFKVFPPIPGYYRGRIFRYDPGLKRLVAEVTEKSTWSPQEFPENIEELPRYTFEGEYEPGEENVLPMPYKALPLPDTLQPADAFTIMRDRNGTFSLEPKKEIKEPVAFKFTFLMCETDENEINDEPLPRDTEKFSGSLDEKSRKTLDQIRSDKFLSELDRSRSITAFTQSRFVYPEDKQVEEMNQRYRNASENLRPEMDAHGIADCHWSNINASLLDRELDIPSRVPNGYFITKNPDCDFSAIGGIGHAWREVWDRTSDPEDPKWEKMDATPNKKDQKDEEKDKRDPGDVQAEDAEPGELSEEAIAAIIEEVGTVPALQRDTANALFQARTKVSPEKWRKVEAFIKQVNELKVPKEDQIPETPEIQRLYGDRIKAQKGTLQREFEKLFALICEHRQIPRRAFRGPVPQSEGVLLRDAVTATIDIMAGSSDPGGFETEVSKPKTVIDVKAFEEDVLVDLTASMEDRDSFGHVMKIEQKKLILGMLYHLMRLNALLNDSRTRSDLRTPVQIKSEIFGIRGIGDAKGIWSVLKTSQETITEQLLTQLADELDKTSAGQGDCLSALKAYRESITPETQKRLQNGELVKMLTIYSDGMVYCLACGKECHDYQVDVEILQLIKQEVQALREMGVIVQGIGFTKKAEAIKAICADSQDPDAAVLVDDCSRAVLAQQKMLMKHLKKL